MNFYNFKPTSALI